MYYGEHGVARRYIYIYLSIYLYIYIYTEIKAPLALRAARPHTVGYTGGGDQEQGVYHKLGGGARLRPRGRREGVVRQHRKRQRPTLLRAPRISGDI